MEKFEPQGRKLLVSLLQETENHKTDKGIEIIQDHISKGVVVEVSNEYGNIYHPGDVIAFSKNAGVSQVYNSKQCLWIDAKAAPDGDVWFIIKESK